MYTLLYTTVVAQLRPVLGEEFNISWRMLFTFGTGSTNINILKAKENT